MSSRNNDSRHGSPLSAVVLALCILCMLSLLPWGELTENRFKDFNLFSEILREGPVQQAAELLIDPALAEALANGDDDNEAVVEESVPKAVNDSVMDAPGDSVTAPAVEVAPRVSDKPYHNPRIEGRMIIEDYGDGSAVARMRSAAASGTLRCAMIGDSYIEGDIFAGSIREKLRERFGGAGVGYVPMTSAVSGFRRTVRLNSSGFTACDIRRDRRDSLHTLSGEYFKAAPGAKASFKGEKGGTYTGSWTRSRLMFLAPSNGTISTSIDGVEWTEHPVTASSDIQCVQVDAPTSRFDVRCDVPGLVVFGAWLDTPGGLGFDCMSLRGYSGISHRSLSIPAARALARWNDYDVIVVEYGMNALSASQSDYTAYSNIMNRVLLRIKACYPSSAIIMLGVGDRGQKSGGDVTSLATTSAMVDAQRRAAHQAGVMFWDTREAMGGANSIVDWRNRGLVNADYIHLNYKGGVEMAGKFVESLNRLLDE
ncbi:MAG: hypothetical protein K2M12_04060 [Muribaculaceae bacterium]|nr:hypothetical protein [Muribaculaceae bacterium]